MGPQKARGSMGTPGESRGGPLEEGLDGLLGTMCPNGGSMGHLGVMGLQGHLGGVEGHQRWTSLFEWFRKSGSYLLGIRMWPCGFLK